MKHQKPPFSQFRVQTLKTVQSLIGRLPSHALDPNHIDRRRRWLNLPASVAGEIPDCGNLENYPWGARIVLNESDPVFNRQRSLIAKMREARLNANHTRRDKVNSTLEAIDWCPKNDFELPEFIAARFFFLFDHVEAPNHLSSFLSRSDDDHDEQSDNLAIFLNFDYKDVLAAAQWLMINKRAGGRSGYNNFEIAWRRDLQVFNMRFNGNCPTSSPAIDAISKRLFGKKVKPQRVVWYIFSRLFEIERAWEYVFGYLREVKYELQQGFNDSGLRKAEVSPVGMFEDLLCHPNVPRTGLQDQAKHNFKSINKLKLLKRSVYEGRRQVYSRCLGDDALGFLIHIAIWMAEEVSIKKKANITDETASEIYRFAFNILAWIDPQHAKNHLAKRIKKGAIVNNVSKSVVISELAAMTRPPSMFSMRPNMPKSMAQWMDAKRETLGAHLVREQRRTELKRSNKGLRDPLRNPYIRASYWPSGWNKDQSSKALLDSWIIMRERLATLDSGYASKKLTVKELTLAVRFALQITETPFGPANDLALALDTTISIKSITELIDDNPSAKKFHLGQKIRIPGLSKNKKSLETDVFNARSYFVTR